MLNYVIQIINHLIIEITDQFYECKIENRNVICSINTEFTCQNYEEADMKIVYHTSNMD